MFHSILLTNKILYKIKKKQLPYCPNCHDIDQTPLQLFEECPICKSFRKKFTIWYNVIGRGQLNTGFELCSKDFHACIMFCHILAFLVLWYALCFAL